MDVVIFLLDILKYSVAGTFIVVLAYYFIRNQFETYYSLKELEYKSSISKDIIPLKLQACERMTLFIERINPVNLLIRIHQPGMSAKQMQQLLIEDIRLEYEHNMVQQLYISNQAWSIIKRVKNDTIAMVNLAVSQLPENASAVELSKIVYAKMDEFKENPYDLALMIIKKQIEDL